jgi:hypothetical protein
MRRVCAIFAHSGNARQKPGKPVAPSAASRRRWYRQGSLPGTGAFQRQALFRGESAVFISLLVAA